MISLEAYRATIGFFYPKAHNEFVYTNFSSLKQKNSMVSHSLIILSLLKRVRCRLLFLTMLVLLIKSFPIWLGFKARK